MLDLPNFHLFSYLFFIIFKSLTVSSFSFPNYFFSWNAHNLLMLFVVFVYNDWNLSKQQHLQLWFWLVNFLNYFYIESRRKVIMIISVRWKVENTCIFIVLVLKESSAGMLIPLTSLLAKKPITCHCLWPFLGCPTVYTWLGRILFLHFSDIN